MNGLQRIGLALYLFFFAAVGTALAITVGASSTGTTTGVSGLWILANASYAGMRAQDSRRSGWRIVAFIFGFPGTLISFLAVKEGGERVYGIDSPKKTW